MQTQPLHNYKQPTTSTNNKTKHMQQQISKYQQQSNTCKHTCKPLPKKEQLQNKQTHLKHNRKRIARSIGRARLNLGANLRRTHVNVDVYMNPSQVPRLKEI